MPEATEWEVCKNTPFTVIPQEGHIFYFYEDEAKTQLISKGSSLTIAGIQQSKRYFITNVDKLLESAVSTIAVNVHPVKAEIHVASDSLILEEANNVEISNLSKNAFSSFWLYPTGTFDTTRVLVENFNDTGQYDYQLVALSKEGCSDTTDQRITIYKIIGIEDFKDPDVSIYPNPTSSTITIDIGRVAQKTLDIVILDLAGKYHQRFTFPQGKSSLEVSLDLLPHGAYFVRSLSGDSEINFKIIKSE
jgi:hypothetical protein